LNDFDGSDNGKDEVNRRIERISAVSRRIERISAVSRRIE
jgi:hypothetical protein